MRDAECAMRDREVESARMFGHWRARRCRASCGHVFRIQRHDDLPHRTSRIAHLLTAILVIVLAVVPAGAAENKYDVLGKTLVPFINVLAEKTKNPNRALSLAARIERLTGLPPELVGARAELDLQYPDRLRLRAPILGEPVTAVRKGQQLWATPGARLQAALDLAIAEKRVPKLDPKDRLEPFRLPLPQKQLVFLPALFEIGDAGFESLDGAECRVLHLALMPELDRQLEQRGWRARLWVRSDAKPARLVLTRPGWELAVRFERVEFAPRLPEATWEPPADDVLQLDAPRFQQLLRSIMK